LRPELSAKRWSVTAAHLNLYVGGRVYLTITCGDRRGLFACYDDGCSSFQTDATRPGPPP